MIARQQISTGLLTALLVATPAFADNKGGHTTGHDGNAAKSADMDNTAQNTAGNYRSGTTADSMKLAGGDVELAANIRQAIVKDDSLSTNAHNVKIVANEGKVVLKGPVESEKERAAVIAKAEQIAGAKNVMSELKINN